MAEFNIRSESVDVEQIMKQIRSRIREKRGVDYTEEQVRELATVRLEKFLDPKNLRSDLLEQFRRSRPTVQEDPPPIQPPYEFTDETLFASHRGPLRFIRKLLRPILKLFFNPNTLNQILHTQAQFNVDMMKREQRRRIEFERSRADWNALYYEVLHNLVLETTRNGIELKNLKMRVEALASRLDFNERRVRAMEGVVQYRPEAVRPRDRQRPRVEAETTGDAQDPALVPTGEGAPQTALAPGGAAESRRRRRRRRGRRGATDRMAPEERTASDAADSAEISEDADERLAAEDADNDISVEGVEEADTSTAADFADDRETSRPATAADAISADNIVSPDDAVPSQEGESEPFDDPRDRPGRGPDTGSEPDRQ
jgi:hypothetical protein